MVLSRFGSTISLALISFFLCGCGSKYTHVEGTVTYNKVPIPIARLTFINEEDKGAICEVENGKFIAPYVPKGETVKLTVSTSVILDELKGFDRAAAAVLPEELPLELVGELHPLSIQALGDRVERYKLLRDKRNLIVPVPEKYEKKDDTPLTFTIEGAKQTLELILTD